MIIPYIVGMGAAYTAALWLLVRRLRLLEGTGVCLGRHTNICLGKPCADPAKIPSLLDENGN